MGSCRSSKNIPCPELCPFPDPGLPLFPASNGAVDYPTPAYQAHLPTLVDNTRAVSVPVGIATTRGVVSPREPVPPIAVAVARHGHDRRANDENAACILVPLWLLAVVLRHFLCWLRRLAHCPATSLQALTQSSWLSSGPYVWYGILAIENPYFRPPLVAVLATPPRLL